jgi:hypothetical protein
MGKRGSKATSYKHVIMVVSDCTKFKSKFQSEVTAHEKACSFCIALDMPVKISISGMVPIRPGKKYT